MASKLCPTKGEEVVILASGNGFVQIGKLGFDKKTNEWTIKISNEILRKYGIDTKKTNYKMIVPKDREHLEKEVKKFGNKGVYGLLYIKKVEDNG